MFKNKTAIITGASRGIGYETAMKLAENGIEFLVITGTNSKVEKSAKEISNKTNCKVLPFICDVSKVDEIEKLFSFSRKKMSNIDILINSVGICPSYNIEEENADEWDNVMNVNLRGTYLCIREVLPDMIKRNYGKILSISSLAAKIGGISSSVGYAASKGGLISMTRTIAKRVAQYNINVNSICPGVIDTDMTKDVDYTSTLKIMPSKRLGTVDDVSDLILFLVSDKSSYIHGSSIDINGGLFM